MKQDWALLIGFGLAITGCCAALAYVAAGGGDVTSTLVAGMAFLAGGHILLLILMIRQSDTLNDKLLRVTRVAHEVRAELRTKMDMALSRINQVQHEAESRTETMIGGISDPKTSYSALRQSLAEQVANPPAAEEPEEEAYPVLRREPALAEYYEEEPVAERAEPEIPAVAPHPLADKVNFALEPVVDMRSHRTAHYRLHLSMQIGNHEARGDMLVEQVARAGMRPQLDCLAVEETLGLLARLRQRDPELCVMMPVGAETLSDPYAVERIVHASRAAGSLAQGLVLEIKHSDLPLLSPTALEGLAQLSRQGQSFALADAAPGALDLQAMKTLHVRMVGIDVAELMHHSGIGDVAQFAKKARLHGISSMITGVTDPQMMQRLSQVTPLACGACFASPRRVKRLMTAEDVRRAA